PAAGPNIASFLSYIAAKQRAKGEEREKFGKGSYTGLMAAEETSAMAKVVTKTVRSVLTW
ncbi:tripartite tricarboxylate transporter permease, partial [Candidatus Roizmanbacteria bacterium]|nr:tripartite tricarboxylate transporter permease [Candidatus Roizmanbacteria bacterium]